MKKTVLLIKIFAFSFPLLLTACMSGKQHGQSQITPGNALLVFAFSLPLFLIACMGGKQPGQSQQTSGVALIIIDVQNDYFEGGNHTLYNALGALSNVEDILKKFRSRGLPVIHVQHINQRGAGFFINGTWGVEIHENLTPLENEALIVKRQVNSFAGTRLEEILKDKRISRLVICGMQTSLCVDGTTRAGKTLEFEITLLEDACAAPNIEAHNNAIATLRNKYATVIKTREYVF